MGEILWQPDEGRIRRSKMFLFLQAVNNEYRLDLKTYPQLHEWSIKNPQTFWEFYSRFSGIKFHKPPDKILSSNAMPGARWFLGAELNYAENLLNAPAHKTAIISKAENKPLTRLTFGQLAGEVSRFVSALEHAGVREGDRIAGYLPNAAETVIAHLGAAAIGAIWSSCSPDFGPQGVLSRFGQIEPKILICADGYSYNGKTYSLLETLNGIAKTVNGLTHIVVVPFSGAAFRNSMIDFPQVLAWDEFLDGKKTDRLNYRPVSFNHPLCILYSSGTTGLPKCIVHGTGGVLLQHHKEHALHTNIGSDDTVFYYTTCGWMMWNWLVSALAQQAAIVLYDGSPVHPSPQTLWKLTEEAGTSVFGTSPKFISSARQRGEPPKSIANLKTLKTILSTGSPLEEDLFRWVYQNVKSDIMLSSISGGSDIISCFMLGNPMLPVRTGEIQCLGLGMDVAALDERGVAVCNRKGELACRAPAPSMPLYFWNDDNNSKYAKAYFDKIPGTWLHGDFIEIKDHGGVIVYGRSDATLNPGGVRIGTAEIYAVTEKMEEIADSLVVGIDENNDVRVILFVALKENLLLDSPLGKKIRDTLRREASPRHVPQEIYRVVEVPRTLNGKKVELAVRNLFLGKPVENLSALVNPHCLTEYADIRDKRLSAKPVQTSG